jgi:hypothetical protein
MSAADDETKAALRRVCDRYAGAAALGQPLPHELVKEINTQDPKTRLQPKGVAHNSTTQAAKSARPVDQSTRRRVLAYPIQLVPRNFPGAKKLTRPLVAAVVGAIIVLFVYGYFAGRKAA